MTNKRPNWHRKPDRIKDLEDALEDVQVHPPGMWENELSQTVLHDWYAVSTADDGIIAYFHAQPDANSFRLEIIDRWLNG